MLNRSVKATLLGAVAAVALGTAVPSATADPTCQDLGGNGSFCTTGDPSTGHFGVGLHTNQGLNLCVVIFARCPEPPA
jgi:hypothetical protein